MLPNLLQISIFWLVQASALLVFFVTFRWEYLALWAVSHFLRAIGLTLCFHRYLAHRAFKMNRAAQFAWAFIGTAAMQKGPLWWAGHHVNHHRYADREGDPHSPIDGLLHAHVGWMFGVSGAKRERYCRRLMGDPVVMLIERTALVWLALGLVVPALIDGWRGLLWGGLVRMAIHNHAMFAVNSICHAFGSQEFATGDESRNNRLIAVLAFGEGWHNNHHAFPASAYHGMGWRQPDLSGLVIRLLVRCGLAWNVREPSPRLLVRKRRAPVSVSAAP